MSQVACILGGMPDQPAKLQRWLDVIAYLVGRRLPVSVDELMHGVPAYSGRWISDEAKDRESVRRQFERDKDELRKAGIPIRTLKYHTADEPDAQEGYVLNHRDFYLPYLHIVRQLSTARPYHPDSRPATVEIREADVPLALAGLRRVADVPGFPLVREARSAFRKLAFDLDATSFSSHTPVLFVERTATADYADRLRVLSDALLARKRVRFRYHGIERNEVTERDVAAYGLLFQHGNWYVIGHDALRDGIRVFRVGRMDDVIANTKAPNTADYAIPADFRLDAYTDRKPWDLGEQEDAPLRARVLFPFPLSLWAERNEHGVLESAADDGAQIRSFDVYQVAPFLRWLLALVGEARLLEPPALVDELRTSARAIVDAHDTADPHTGAGDA